MRPKTFPTQEPPAAVDRRRTAEPPEGMPAGTGLLPDSVSSASDGPWRAFRSAWDRLDAGATAAERAALAWESPRGETFAALGIAAAWSSSRPDAIAEARRAVPELVAGTPGATVAIGLFPFEPGQADAPARWFVPRRLWSCGPDGAVVERRAEPADATRRAFDPPARSAEPAAGRPAPGRAADRDFTRENWTAAVRDALDRIGAGALGKAVLARAATLSAARPYDPVRVFEALRAAQPGAYRFLVAPGDGPAFLGASPERLVRLSGGLVLADSIAGTIRRGADAAEDARLSAELLASAKDRREHAAVAREVRAALERWCDGVDAALEPGVLGLAQVLHLRTRVRGVPRPGTHVLDLVAALHPTPAVAGTPREAALAWIRVAEPSPRGWYAGPVGWMNASGEGDFAVGLRCALLDGARARIHAGAGLVAGSDPDAEWKETELKMGAMRDVLAGG